MIQANEMTQLEVEEALEEDMHDQFNDMYYTIECNICGERITGVLLSKDLSPRVNPHGMHDAMVTHNLTHYKKPTVVEFRWDDAGTDEIARMVGLK